MIIQKHTHPPKITCEYVTEQVMMPIELSYFPTEGILMSFQKVSGDEWRQQAAFSRIAIVALYFGDLVEMFAVKCINRISQVS